MQNAAEGTSGGPVSEVSSHTRNRRSLPLYPPA